jgi:iron complex transport system substrate-binding protein
MLIAPLLLLAVACQAGATTPPSSPTTAPATRAATTAPTGAEPTRTPVTPTSAPATTAAASAPATAEAPTDSPVAFPLELVDDEGTTVALEAEPERVVSLTPATTELLFALDEGEKLVGRTAFDDYPPEAAELPAVAEFTGVLIEQVVDLEPDLILAGGNSFTPPGDVTRLRELGFPVLVLYAEDFEGVMADIELVGQAVGAPAQASAITAEIAAQQADVVAAVEDLRRPRVFYEIGYGPEIYAPAPESFVADMVSLAGGEPVTTGDPTLFSISLEQLVTADPETIVLGDAAYPPPICPDTVAAREGWSGITAVAAGEIRPVNDIIVTRPGPRIGDGLTALALAIHPDIDLAEPADSGLDLCG